MIRFSLPLAPVCQLSVAAAILTVIALSPPQRGAMLLVPLTGQIATVVNVAMAGKAALLGQGPLPGSMIVIGDRAALRTAASGRGILLLSAPRALCGDRAAGGTV
ncbi:hypothetical protein [uncultured Sphingomonas sp.]|uniref:hypothetical protein n=1 Tax=uncultured Sphingomonas sp. TaxID=158754 RepID=UPI0025EB9A56|nr:hypothetical protein [uncultured Sphingomonas sp.]